MRLTVKAAHKWSLALLGLVLASGVIGAFQAVKLASVPIDPQKVQDQQDMTWADYHPIPGVNWADPSLTPSKKQFRVALIAVDFPDQPFVVTLPKHSDLFGNPQIDPIPRERVPQFYADFYNAPSAINHGQTINGYWMEQSRGQIGIGKIDVFGPYRMPKNLFQYGLNEWGQKGGVPGGFEADGRLEFDAAAMKVGESRPVVIHASHAGRGEATASLTLRAVSESDPSQSAAASCSVRTAN